MSKVHFCDMAELQITELEEENQRLKQDKNDMTRWVDDAKQERDAALARVKELESRLEASLIHEDELSSDVQCAKLAADLASKEREALRSALADAQKLLVWAGNSTYVNRETKVAQMSIDWTQDRDNLIQRAAALLGTEEPK